VVVVVATGSRTTVVQEVRVVATMASAGARIMSFFISV
jgi:hypothetical protein